MCVFGLENNFFCKKRQKKLHLEKLDIGGLILNLMPCVFPVIALKALSFIKISEHAPHQAKLHGWSYTVGVLSSFVAIALVLIGLKAAGESLGWGFQLQAPEIVGGLTLLMVLHYQLIRSWSKLLLWVSYYSL